MSAFTSERRSVVAVSLEPAIVRAEETIQNIRSILGQLADDGSPDVDIMQAMYQAIETLAWIAGYLGASRGGSE